MDGEETASTAKNTHQRPQQGDLAGTQVAAVRGGGAVRLQVDQAVVDGGGRRRGGGGGGAVCGGEGRRVAAAVVAVSAAGVLVRSSARAVALAARQGHPSDGQLHKVEGDVGVSDQGGQAGPLLGGGDGAWTFQREGEGEGRGRG